MSYIISFTIAILLTALSYFFGSSLITNAISIWKALIIGISVVSIGAITEQIGAPKWLIVMMPFPVGMLLLFLFLNQPLHIWFFTLCYNFSFIHNNSHYSKLLFSVSLPNSRLEIVLNTYQAI
ncbi:hypothetical protein [Oceanobacillus salinisoli]|uniref:hypothetical protein n=1 Tax=Oceanobacillus salinisoli TaxID=2678611 RepID=UPI001E29A26A|nr:hypothetical protein [Oceanobacillus salinisoli]